MKENSANNVMTEYMYASSGKNPIIQGTNKLTTLNVAEDEEGKAELSNYEIMPYYQSEIFRGSISIPKKITVNGFRYPFDGTVTAGQILQMNGLTVLPYQAGRGVPEHETNYLVVNTDIPYETMPSMGCVQGNNDFCIGVALTGGTTGEKIDIITSGEVTVTIGAATNIAMQYMSDGTPVIPLYEGEYVEMGSNVYASCMGMEMKTEPQGDSPYPLVSYRDASGVLAYNEDEVLDPICSQMDGRRLNPYWDYNDATYGNYGYTSTGEHGTVIVRADTLDTGSGRKNLLGPPKYLENNQTTKEDEIWDRWTKLIQLPHSPGRSLSIGHSLTTIEGTGTWTYTGEFVDGEQTINPGGNGYLTSITYPTKTDGDGVDLLMTISTIDGDGSITTLTPFVSGTGYQDGDLIYIYSSSYPTATNPWAPATITHASNNAVGVYNAGNVDLINGSGYVEQDSCPTYNISMNSLILNATFVEDQFQYHIKPTLLESVSVGIIEDYTRYKPGTRIGLVNLAVHRDNWAVVEIETNNGVDTITFSIYRYGALGAYKPGTYMYATEILDIESPRVRVEVDTDGVPTRVALMDYPNNQHQEGDLFIVVQPNSRMNCLFNLSYPTITLCKPIVGAAMMYDRALIENVPLYIAEVQVPREFDIGETNSLGQPSTMFWMHNIDTVTSLGTKVFTQIAQPNIYDHPGFSRTFLLNTYAYRDLGYELEARLSFIDRGTGYTLGSATLSGGSGTGGEIYILEVSDVGAILKYRTKTIDSSYSTGDQVTVDGGTTTATANIRHPRSREIANIWTLSDTVVATATDPHFVPQLLWDIEIIEPGTLYALGTYTTTTSYTQSIRVSIKVLEVGGGGEVLEAELDVTGEPSLETQTNYCYTLTGGNNDCIIQLRKPLVAKVPRLVPLTPSNGVARGANNLSTELICIGLCTVVGTITPIAYTSTSKMYRNNDLQRWALNDRAVINQDGNISEIVEVSGIDPAQGVLVWNIVVLGAGYTVPLAEYAFLPFQEEVQSTFDVTDGVITVNTLNAKARFGDIFALDNCVFRLTAEHLVPAPKQEEVNLREATQGEWDQYDAVLSSANNLLNQEIKIDFKKEHPDHYDPSYYLYGDPDNKDPNGAGWISEFS